MLEITLSVLNFIWAFTKAWWWVFLPFLLWKPFFYLWTWWRIDTWLSKQSLVVLEIKVPQDVPNPFKRMENVFAGFWQTKIGKNPRERYLEGKIQLSIALELVSIEGKVHFFMRVIQEDRELLETSIYAQYPEAEVTQVDDYTKYIPQDVPNKDWDLWGTDFMQLKSDVYPIKTYRNFFEEQEGMKEEFRVDPLGQLLEGMKKLGPGEQLWLQFLIDPVTNEEAGHVTRAKAFVDKLARRQDTEESGTVQDVKSAASLLVTGSPIEKKEEVRETFPPEMKLTPGERAVLGAIEEKVSKLSFMTNIRTIYLAKRDVYFGGRVATPLSFFQQFNLENLNSIVFDTNKRTKIYTFWTAFLDKRRLFLRKRRVLRRYLMRVGTNFPLSGGTFVLNIEELATIFHFPGRLTAPGAELPRVEVKKGEAPPGLPTE